jgi:Fe-S-cluster containining protein
MTVSHAPRARLAVPTAPPCRELGSQCRALRVTLRVGSLEEGDASLDHEATWLMGHTEHITFGELWSGNGDLYVEAILHVPCRFLREDTAGAECRLYGYRGAPPRRPPNGEQPRRMGGQRFRVVDQQRMVTRSLPAPAPVARALPVLAGANPCADAPCRTADNRRAAACCRDLQVEIMCTRAERRLEALVRTRRSPYLCKVEREGDFSLDVEMISACGYLEDDGVACSLHGRVRADGRPAKPDLCTEWPPKNRGLHPGCVFGPRRRRRRPSAD